MTPRLSVVVASHDRPLRLRWLLNALAEQELPHTEWEVLVAHDSVGPETSVLLASHPLARAGVLRELRTPPHPGPADKRNAGWRAARAPHVLFTDDDCRPPAGWLTHAVAAAERTPGAIVQGATTPDPDEAALVRAPGWRSMEVHPPVTWAQTCNILYPRAVLEATGGFDEAFPTAAGEDTDLALRARAAGHPYVGDPALLTHHAVEVPGLARRLRDTQRWQHVPALVQRHPQLRRHFPLRLFWKRRHALVLPAAAGVLLARRHPAALLLALPWARAALPHYGPGPRARLRQLAELPATALLDLGEVLALARGSARYRTPLL